jgi:thioredoxin:protein disulfide reductase
MRHWQSILVILIGFMAQAALAITPLPAEQVFKPSVTVYDPNTLLIQWQIKPGYYLYQDKFDFHLSETPVAKLGKPRIPTGEQRFDEVLGDYQVLARQVQIPMPILGLQPGDSELTVDYLGCSASGFCYPPQQFTARLVFNAQAELVDAQLIPKVTSSTAAVPSATEVKTTATDHLSEHKLPWIMLTFVGLGLLLSFTPCVLPMVPILSGIIVGHGDSITMGKAFRLSLVYVLSMSVTYALIGVLFALIGHNLQVMLQIPWVIGLTSAIFVLLALSMFGVYQLALPERWQAGIAGVSHRQTGGAYLGVVVMGSLATLILSPCVTVPLVGALTYITSTGNVLIGASALFALGFGMGIPLLLIGTSAGKLLPKAGNWMKTIQAGFGVLLLAVAIYLLERIIPESVTLLLWGSLLIVCAIYLGALRRTATTANWRTLWQGLGIVILVSGIALVLGAAMGHTNVFAPLQTQPSASPIRSDTLTGQARWQVVNSIDDVEAALARAQQTNQPVMLDFYADWCIACKSMERNVFSDPVVQAALSHYVILKADITTQNAMDQALMQKYNVIAPPTLLFFNTHGDLSLTATLVGEVTRQDFLTHIQLLAKQDNLER